MELEETESIEPDCVNGECGMPVLSSENGDVWHLYQTINSQFVYDFHALPLVFDVWAMRLTQDEAKVLLEKLIMIHGVLSQKKEKSNGGEESGSS